MSKYSFYKEMCDEFSTIEKIDSKTLEYRFDMFLLACTNDLTVLENSKPVQCTGDNGLPYVNKSKNNDEEKYNINFCLNYNHTRGKSVVLMGMYNSLNLMFINYCDSDKRKNEINELPFHIKLGETFDDVHYEMEIKGEPKEHTKFILKKYHNDTEYFNSLVFYANIVEFGDILKLVNSFVKDPKTIYERYNKTIDNKKIMITYNDLKNNFISSEDTLCEPVKGLKKITKKLFK